MTRDDIQAMMADEIKSSVTRNRLLAILTDCKTIDEFVRLSEGEALAHYRNTELGKKSGHDLGKVTHTELSRVQGRIMARLREEKKAEQAAQKAELWFTREEITLAAAFMETYNVSGIELSQLRKLLDALKRDKKPEPEKAAAPDAR